ncbi:MAG: hypothetical protein II509_03415 [Prevotella sp.]|nr:hypothetical protein [Prevotella sp.]
MKRYTKEYIEKLLDKFMDGTSTLEEEDILAQYFRHQEVPREWEEYRLLFQEIDAMKPVQTEIVEINPENRRKRWMRWGVAAAVVAGILYFAVPSKQIEPTAPLTAKVDTTATVAQPEIPISETKTDTVSPQKPPVESPKRSRRKPRPTMLDHDKAYVLMAQAEQEIHDVERQLAQCQQEIVEAQLAALGYIPVMQEDGTIIYINEQQNLIAYED